MRYLKATIVIGAISICATLLLDAAGWIATLETLSAQALARVFGAEALAATPRAVTYALAAFFAFAAAWTTVDISRTAGKIGVAVAGAALLLTGSVVVALYGVYVSPYQAVVAVAISASIGLGYGGTHSGARKKVLERLFGRRLSRSQLADLLDDDIGVEFGGTDLDGSVVVCEIHNHVELMDSLRTEDYVAMTNLYLRAASDYLVDAGGYLDECSGESLRVVFGAPLARPDHAQVACRAAIELVVRIEELNKECDARWNRRIDFRVGINSGGMVAAAYGGERLGSFSVAGPTVEFARRLCAACPNYGCRVLIGPDTYADAAETIEVRPVEMLQTPDRRRLELYELMAPKGGLSPERMRAKAHCWNGAIFYREKKWDLALAEFEKARIMGIPDPALDQFVLRVERARRGSNGFSYAPELLAEIR